MRRERVAPEASVREVVREAGPEIVREAWREASTREPEVVRE